MSLREGPLESETCRDFVLPALRASGWQPEQIVEQRYFTDGRIIAMAFGHRRSEGKRTDYLLHLRPDLPLAVVEAKREYRLPSDGLQQAMDYAELLGLGFAYASNGKGIVEHDYDTGRQLDVSEFPSRWRGLWDGLLRSARGIGAQTEARRLGVNADRLLATEVQLPPVDEQARVVERMGRVALVRARADERVEKLVALEQATLNVSLGVAASTT